MLDRKRLLNEENLPFPISSLDRLIELICYFANSVDPRFSLDANLVFNNEETSIRAFSEKCDFELGLSIQKNRWPDLTLTIKHLHLKGSNKKAFIYLVLKFAAIAKDFNYQRLGMSQVPEWLAAIIKPPGFKSIDERTHVLELGESNLPANRWNNILQ